MFVVYSTVRRNVTFMARFYVDLIHGLAFGKSKLYIAPYGKICTTNLVINRASQEKNVDPFGKCYISFIYEENLSKFSVVVTS